MGSAEDNKQIFNCFHFNSIKPATGLTSTQLAARLGITYQAFVKIQNNALLSPINLRSKTYKGVCELIEEYGLTFPEPQTITLDLRAFKGKDKEAILTSFQYKTAI